jgi:hypothetical protein
MGFYPLPESEGAKLRQLLNFTGPASVVDPCVGQGVAFNLITQGADVRRYGVELDAERALAASATGMGYFGFAKPSIVIVSNSPHRTRRSALPTATLPLSSQSRRMAESQPASTTTDRLSLMPRNIATSITATQSPVTVRRASPPSASS